MRPGSRPRPDRLDEHHCARERARLEAQRRRRRARAACRSTPRACRRHRRRPLGRRRREALRGHLAASNTGCQSISAARRTAPGRPLRRHGDEVEQRALASDVDVASCRRCAAADRARRRPGSTRRRHERPRAGAIPVADRRGAARRAATSIASPPAAAAAHVRYSPSSRAGRRCRPASRDSRAFEHLAGAILQHRRRHRRRASNAVERGRLPQRDQRAEADRATNASSGRPIRERHRARSRRRPRPSPATASRRRPAPRPADRRRAAPPTPQSPRPAAAPDPARGSAG